MAAFWWFLHRSSIHRLIQDNAGQRIFSTFFKDRCLSILRMQLHTNILCKRLRVHEWLNQITGHSFLALIKKMTNCFENSICKLLSFNHHNSSLAWQVCGFLKFQLCIIGVTRTASKLTAWTNFLVYVERLGLLDFSWTVTFCLIAWFLSGTRHRARVLSPEQKCLC